MALHFEIGKKFTLTKTFAESDVYLFAGIIGDLFPAHVNEEYCKKMPYKTRLVHGCLTFSLCSTVSGMAGVDSGHDILAMGYDQAQTLKAIREAESYPGPAIVICYCPCLEQHIKAGMGTSQDEMKKAVECGYWHLYRYDPRRIAEGKNPFQLDSKEPDTSKVMDFLMGENRFASLKNNFPDKADALYAKEVEDVKARYAKYKKLAEG